VLTSRVQCADEIWIYIKSLEEEVLCAAISRLLKIIGLFYKRAL